MALGHRNPHPQNRPTRTRERAHTHKHTHVDKNGACQNVWAEVGVIKINSTVNVRYNLRQAISTVLTNTQGPPSLFHYIYFHYLKTLPKSYIVINLLL